MARCLIAPVQGEAPRPDLYERSGSGKTTISVLDFARFPSALDRGPIVPEALVETTKAGRLGFDMDSDGKAGPSRWKKAAAPSRARTAHARPSP